ncbi:hypothetical protein AC626_12010 [Pseudoalteromonas rubra]|uniref:Carrier domain-containing protein n=1 Tax=Pseudoalteromonas rubra TaxID=43658 RepID=A0A0L0ERX4_9GAMM|nr:hypothetical protein AC626_12010 [Pseudoalteromonas rubra]
MQHIEVRKIISNLYQAGIVIWQENGQLKTKSKPGAMTPALIEIIKKNKLALIDCLAQEEESVKVATVSAIPVRDKKEAPLPLSFAQQRLWFIEQLQGPSSMYNMPFALRISGTLPASLIEQALAEIVTRHEVLRTTYTEHNEQPIQVVHDSVSFTLGLEKLNHLDDTQRADYIAQAQKAEAAHPFDLDKDQMLRAKLLVCGEQEQVLLLTLHHIASDGVSMDVLMREFGALLEGIATGQPVSEILPPLEIQYADYALWQRDWLSGDELQRQRDYWCTQLAELPATHSLVLDRARPARMSHQGDHVSVWLDAELLHDLKQLARHHDMTLFMVLHGAFALLLSKHSYERDIVIGTPVANRRHESLESLIGFFVNTLVLRLDVDPQASVEAFLQNVKAVNLAAQGHQDIPFEFLVEALSPQRSQQHTPLFQVMMNYQLTKENERADQSELTFTPLSSDREVAKFDLTLAVTEYQQHSGDKVCCNFNFATDIFDRERMAGMASHFVCLLGEMAQSSRNTAIAKLSLLNKTERQQVIAHAQAREEQQIRQSGSLLDAFERAAKQHAEQSAVTYVQGERIYELSFAQLSRRSNQLAHYLQRSGVQPGQAVGLMTQRSADLIVGMLGILKAGGVYVPLDPVHPSERLNYMAKNSALTLVVTDQHYLGRVTEELVVSGVSLSDSQMWDALPETLPDVRLESDSPAYIIYTSGSTGQPKGVQVSHGALLNLAFNIHSWPVSLRRWGLTVSYGFDASLKGLSQLLLGTALTILDDEQKFDAEACRQVIARTGIEVLDCTPGLVSLWLSEGLADVLPDLVIGGEAITETLWQSLVEWQQQTGRVALNVYGPTECCVDSTWCVIAGEEPTIGEPLLGVSCFVMNSGNQLAPIGVPGELYIGGAGVALGYVDQPELSAERFIPNPFGSGRLYRTGDLVRYSDDGKLLFMGRTDDQIKVRGYRIEPGEIMQQIDAIKGVNSSLVSSVTDDQGVEQLVAYVTLDTLQRSDAVSEWLTAELAKGLPAYMIPSVFICLEQWPLTANGKIDKRALPQPDRLAQQVAYVAPANSTEQALVTIWAALLGLETDSLSVTANFFALGGHSLLATRLVTQIRAKLAREISVRAVFDNQTIRSLASALAKAASAKLPPLVAQPRADHMPLSFAQQRLWFIEQLQGPSNLYNMPLALRITGTLPATLIEQALTEIVARHEVLRTTYCEQGELPGQVIHAPGDFTVAQVSLTSLNAQQQAQYIKQALNDEAITPFDLSQDGMLRARLLVCGEQEQVLLLTLHHIASDGVSMEVLMREFGALLEGQGAGKPVSEILPPLEVQYADYALWQRSWLNGEELQRQRDYWCTQLAELPATHSLVLDRARPARMSHQGDHVSMWLDAELLHDLKQLARDHDMTLFMVLHGAFALLLSKHSYERDIVIGTPVANRRHEALESLIGFFVNTLVLRLDVDPQASVEAFLQAVKAVNLTAQEHQDVPFESLVESLSPERSQQHTPLFQIMMNYLQVKEDARAARSELTFTPLSSDQEVAKFELMLTVTEYQQHSGDKVCCNFNFATDIFDRERIADMAARFGVLLRSLCESQVQSVDQLEMLTEQDQAAALAYATPDMTAFQQTSIHGLFEQQAALYPEHTALEMGSQSLSYDTLNARRISWRSGCAMRGWARAVWWPSACHALSSIFWLSWRF